MLFPLLCMGQETIQIGTGENNVYKIPFNGLYDYSHEMFIYTESELGGNAKEIYEIGYYLEGYTQGYQINDITIKLAHTTDNSFSSNTRVDLSGINYSELTTCLDDYDLTIDENGWIKFTFSTFFQYKGSGNLLVIVENRDGTWSPGFGYTQCSFDNSSYRSWMKYQDDSYPSGSGSGERNKNRPNLKLTYSINNPLPINLLTFEGKLLSGIDDIVKLKWETATEQNNDFFTLSRSIDGIIWENIASISGAGNSNEKTHYQYIDRSVPKKSKEHIYYKLSQTDFNGQSEQFPPIAIILNKKTKGNIISKTNLMGQTVSKSKKGFIIEKRDNGEIVKVFIH